MGVPTLIAMTSFAPNVVSYQLIIQAISSNVGFLFMRSNRFSRQPRITRIHELPWSDRAVLKSSGNMLSRQMKSSLQQDASSQLLPLLFFAEFQPSTLPRFIKILLLSLLQRS
jgi:hypothetical protein